VIYLSEGRDGGTDRGPLSRWQICKHRAGIATAIGRSMRGEPVAKPGADGRVNIVLPAAGAERRVDSIRKIPEAEPDPRSNGAATEFVGRG